MKVCSTKRNVVEIVRLDDQHCCLTKIFRENLEEKHCNASDVHKSLASGRRSTKFCRWRLMFVGTQYGACCMSHLMTPKIWEWPVDFWKIYGLHYE